MTQNYNGLGVGRHRIMDLPHSMYAVYLSTVDAVLNESNKLHIRLNVDDVCAIENNANVNFYSIRSHDGAPHVLLNVQNDAVQWCRGLYAGRPANYMPQVVTFIVKKQFDIAYDMACTGVIRQNGKYYDDGFKNISITKLSHNDYTFNYPEYYHYKIKGKKLYLNYYHYLIVLMEENCLM